MGGMGRKIDGGYAEFVVVKVRGMKVLDVQMGEGEGRLGWKVWARYQRCCRLPGGVWS